MIAIDTNLLVYAHRCESGHHETAFSLLRELAEGQLKWDIPWPCIYEFYSVVTNVRIWKESATTPSQAWNQIEAWARSPQLTLLAETEDFIALLATFVQRPRVRGPIIHDARIAALCVAHGSDELLTLDRDFQLFPELHTRNPLV